jgi:hypothetical protein
VLIIINIHFYFNNLYYDGKIDILNYSLISPNSIGKNIEIVRPNVMIIGVRTLASPLCVCEFMLVLSFPLSKKNSIKGFGSSA